MLSLFRPDGKPFFMEPEVNRVIRQPVETAEKVRRTSIPEE